MAIIDPKACKYWWSIFEYHKYRLSTGERNPNRNRLTGMILDLKEPENRNHTNAVQFFGRKLAAYLDDMITKDHPLQIAIVPSHEPGKDSSGLQAVVRHVASTFNILKKPPLLTRTNKVDKLARGGNRSKSVHLASIEVNKKAFDPNVTVLLLDDVRTSGNSMAACEELLKKAGAKQIISIALAKTADNDE